MTNFIVRVERTFRSAFNPFKIFMPDFSPAVALG